MYLGPWSIYQKVREKDYPDCDIEGIRSTPTAEVKVMLKGLKGSDLPQLLDGSSMSASCGA